MNNEDLTKLVLEVKEKAKTENCFILDLKDTRFLFCVIPVNNKTKIVKGLYVYIHGESDVGKKCNLLSKAFHSDEMKTYFVIKENIIITTAYPFCSTSISESGIITLKDYKAILS